MNELREINILLVEDNHGDYRIIKESLSYIPNRDFRIIHATRLEDALLQLKNNSFDVILVDLGLPDSQGFDTFFNLKRAVDKIPIIVLSGLDDEALAYRAVQEGAQDYLAKAEVTQGILVRSILYSIEREALLSKLQAKSITDDLTGLYNRRGFFEFANKELALSKRLGRNCFLIYLDIDGLKKINDSFGHEAGDRAIVDIANCIRESFRSSDIIARIGGDEFVVLALHGDEANMQGIITRFYENIAKANDRQERDFLLSVSIGYTQCTAVLNNIDDFLKVADACMYNNKQAKKHYN